MGRPTRIHFPGACYHLTARGNNRQALFLDDDDRQAFFELLAEGISKFEHHLHGFCLMTNHVHLVVEVADRPLSQIAHNICFRYARHINRKTGRQGHLFERRYRAGLVDTDLGLQRVLRYIHLNPVRAGIVDHPTAYPWSSHVAYLGGERPPWLTTHRALGLFADSIDRARSLFANFVAEELNTPSGTGAPPPVSGAPPAPGERLLLDRWQREEPSLATLSTFALRNLDLDDLLREVARASGTGMAGLRSPARHRPLPAARGIAAWLVWRAPHLSLRELAEKLSRESSTLGRSAATLSKARGRDQATDALIGEVLRSLELPPWIE